MSKISKCFKIASAALIFWAVNVVPLQADESPFKISGNLRTLNTFSQSSGLTPEIVENPLALTKEGVDLFSSSNRARLKFKWEMNKSFEALQRTEQILSTQIEYDHQVNAGSAVGRGDYRIIKKIKQERQLLDLSQTIAEDNGIEYEHSLYRAYISYRSEYFDVDLGRQQIPWGVGRFVTPTDVFNPLSITSLEPEERDGVDAINFKTRWNDFKVNYVYTPRGRRLHPSRNMVRVSRDINGFETGLIGGAILHDKVIGYDLQGNIRQAVIRHELLYRDSRDEKDSINFVFNADYNFNNGLYALLEYVYNGRGKSDKADYEILRIVEGEIQYLAKNYLGLQLGYDITPLIRIENSSFFNLDDQSLFNRISLKNSLRPDLMLSLNAILMAGNETDEFNSGSNLYYSELKWYF